MDRCIPDLDCFNFKLDQYNQAMLNSTFELYKSDIKQVFRLFQDLLESLPHVPERQCRQWDITLFVASTASPTLSTYNTVQISKLETAIEAQKQKTDLLADIVKLHKQHLHQLDRMIDDNGREIQALRGSIWTTFQHRQSNCPRHLGHEQALSRGLHLRASHSLSLRSETGSWSFQRGCFGDNFASHEGYGCQQ
jgi:hypothetical protein